MRIRPFARNDQTDDTENDVVVLGKRLIED